MGGFQSFSGEGQSLGGGGGGGGGGVASSSAASSSSSKPSSSSGGGVVDPSGVPPPLEVDESRPVTTVAVRLLDGRRLVVRVNADAPVSEVARQIGSSRAGADVPYVITGGYPPVAIGDLDGQTVEGAGLKGAQVVLKRA